MKNKPEIIVLIGLPCSGKSTFAAQDKYKDYQKISRDAIMMELCPEQSYNNAYWESDVKEVKKIYNERFDNALKDKKNIIIDNTNLTSRARRRALSRVPKDYKKIAVYFNVPMEILKKRNEERAKEGKYISDKVFEEMFSYLSPIKNDEGFDKVIDIP